MYKDNDIYCISLKKIDPSFERLRRPSASAVQKMGVSLKKQGQLTPILLIQNNNYLTLIDGFKRYRAASVLSMDSLKALIVDAAVPKAKALMYLTNRFWGYNIIQEALLVRELVDVDGLTQSETAIMLERHKSWVNRRLMMIRRLQPEIVEDMLIELVPPGSGPSLARLPLCNQSDFCATIQKNNLFPKEIGQLTDLFLKTQDPSIKQFILKSPREAINTVNNFTTRLPTLSKRLERIYSLITEIEKVMNAEAVSDFMAIGVVKDTLSKIKSCINTLKHYFAKENHDKTQPGTTRTN
jgi:hypothetical protein